MAPGDTLQPHLQSRTLTGSCKGCGAWRRRARPAVCRAPRLPSPPTCGHRGPNVWALPGPEAAYCKRQGHASAHGQESVRCVWWRKAYPHPSPQPKHAWPRSRVSACPSWGESAHPSRHWREGSLRAQWAPHPVLGTRPAGLPDSPVSATQLKAEAQRGQVTSKARWLRKGWGWGLGPSGLQAEPHPGPQLTCLLLLLRAMMPRSPRASPVKNSTSSWKNGPKWPTVCPTSPAPRPRGPRVPHLAPSLERRRRRRTRTCCLPYECGAWRPGARAPAVPTLRGWGLFLLWCSLLWGWLVAPSSLPFEVGAVLPGGTGGSWTS